MTDYKKIKDEKLIEIIRQKDKELFNEVISRYENKLLRYTKYLIKDQQMTLDVVQESFIKAYINLNSFDTKKKFSSWIYRITHNTAMNMVKKNHLEIPIKEEMNLISETNTEIIIEQKEIISNINNCLKNIPTIYSEPLILFYLEDKSYEDIADILRLPMGTVATRINRGKVIMKKICQTKK